MHALLPVLRALRDADVSYVVVDGVAEWIRDRNLTVFSLHDPDDPRREVDLFAQEPMPFGEHRGARGAGTGGGG